MPLDNAQCTPLFLARHPSLPFPVLQVLPPLVGVVPEARLNLVLFYCRRGDPARALGLLRGMEAGTAFEHICQVGAAGWVHTRERVRCAVVCIEHG